VEAEGQPKQVNQSLLTVLIAFLANVLLAIAKSIAAVITSSASMLAEAAHSWADTGNEIFLLVADRSGRCSPPLDFLPLAQTCPFGMASSS
jgi:divalent metal cation (Fe/Co/Zn/Cd) transporter